MSEAGAILGYERDPECIPKASGISRQQMATRDTHARAQEGFCTGAIFEDFGVNAAHAIMSESVPLVQEMEKKAQQMKEARDFCTRHQAEIGQELQECPTDQKLCKYLISTIILGNAYRAANPQPTEAPMLTPRAPIGGFQSVIPDSSGRSSPIEAPSAARAIFGPGEFPKPPSPVHKMLPKNRGKIRLECDKMVLDFGEVLAQRHGIKAKFPDRVMLGFQAQLGERRNIGGLKTADYKGQEGHTIPLGGGYVLSDGARKNVSNTYVEEFRKQRLRKLTREFKSQLPYKKPVTFLTVQEFGMGQQATDVLRKAVIPGTTPGHSTSANVKKRILAQALAHLPTHCTDEGCYTDGIALLTLLILQLARRYPHVFAHSAQRAPEGQVFDESVPGFSENVREGETVVLIFAILVKFTADARKVSCNPKISHTEAMLCILHYLLCDTWQSPHCHCTYGLFEGKDDQAGMRRNFSQIAKQLEDMQSKGFIMRVPNPLAGDNEPDSFPIFIQPEVIFAADMATKWGWTGVGGVRDKEGKMCHLCNTLTKDRFQHFEWVKVGDFFTTEEQWVDARLVAAKFSMTPSDFFIINSQPQQSEEHLQNVTIFSEEHTNISRADSCPPTPPLSSRPAPKTGPNRGGRVAKAPARTPRQAQRQGMDFLEQSRLAAQQLKAADEARKHARSADRDVFLLLEAHLRPESLPIGYEMPCTGHLKHCNGCNRCCLKLDQVVRVVARDAPLDRDTSQTAIYDFDKLHMIFCALHCLMRVTECLFTALAEVAQKAGQQSVDDVNVILRQYGVTFQMKVVTNPEKKQRISESGAAAVQYNKVKLPGNCAVKLIDAAPAVIRYVFPVEMAADDASTSMRPEEVAATGKKLSKKAAALQQQEEAKTLGMQRDWNLKLWHSWGKVARMMYDNRPESPDTYDLAVTHFAVCLAAFHSCDEDRSLYLHSVVRHSRTYYRRWGGLAKFANQGAELKHTFGKRAYKRTGQGGCFGRTKNPKPPPPPPPPPQREPESDDMDISDPETEQETEPEEDKLPPPKVMVPKNKFYWPKTEPGTVEPRSTVEQVHQNVTKHRTILVVFQQLLLQCYMSLVYMCKICDAYGDCKHTTKSKHGNFTPANVKTEAKRLEAQFKNLPNVFTKADELHGYLQSDGDPLTQADEVDVYADTVDAVGSDQSDTDETYASEPGEERVGQKRTIRCLADDL